MDCDLAHITRCIDVQYNFMASEKAPSEMSDQMPVCFGRWLPMPDPLPPGSYGIVYTARVTEEAPKDTQLRVMIGGKTIAVVRWGQTRNWTCVPGALETVS